MTKENKPEMRFSGFNEDWKQRKLGDIATFLNGRAYSQDELQSSGKYKILRVGNFYTNDSWYYSDMELGEKFYANKGDLLYTWSATFGPHIWEGDKVIYHYHIWKIALTEFLDKMFALQLLEQDKSNLLNNLNGSTMVHMTKLGMESKQVIIPNSLEEQAKIGSFFTQLDNTITLQQRKLELLKNQKKAFLEKMFPKEGENVPEIRFSGFSDAWKQRKLGDIATFLNGRAYSQDELQSSGKYKILRVGNFYTNDSWYYSDMELGEKFYANKGDLLYTWSATFGPHIWEGDKVIYHYHIWKIALTEFLDKMFALQLLEQDKSNLLNNLNGSTMVHMTKLGMESKQVIIPNSLEEQAKIGSFFTQLDNTITLQQRKLEILKNIKKSFLQKMFV